MYILSLLVITCAFLIRKIESLGRVIIGVVLSLLYGLFTFSDLYLCCFAGGFIAYFLPEIAKKLLINQGENLI